MHHLQPTSARAFQPIAESGFYFCYHLEAKCVRTSKVLLRSWKREHTAGREIDLLMEYPCQKPSSHPTKETGCIRRPGSDSSSQKKRTGPGGRWRTGTVEYLWEEHEGRRLDGMPDIETKQEGCMRIRRRRSNKRSHAQVDFLHPTDPPQFRKKVTCRPPTPPSKGFNTSRNLKSVLASVSETSEWDLSQRLIWRRRAGRVWRTWD